MSGSSDKVDRKDVKRILDMREKVSSQHNICPLLSPTKLWLGLLSV